MSRKCVICHHEQKQLIEDSLVVVGFYRQIAEAFKLSKDAVRRHALNHLPAAHQVIHSDYEINLAVHGTEYADRWGRIKNILQEAKARHLSPIWRDVTQKIAQRRKHPVCRCPAYGFPHKQKTGFCRFPNEPLEVWQGEVGKPSTANLQRRNTRRVWRFLSR